MGDLFFSDRLRGKMAELLTAPLTAVAAPAGCGKTTAVRSALERVPGERVRWYTAVESEKDGSFAWFISQLEPEDGAAARRLRELCPLNRSNAADAAELLGRLRIDEPLYIVMDNFQYLAQSWQPQLLSGLADRRDGLRVVLSGQGFGRLEPVLSGARERICSIMTDDLSLTEANIAQFAAQLGVNVTPDEIKAAFLQSAGWTVAVALYLENLRRCESGSCRANDTDSLLWQLVWMRLSGEQREILLRLSLFDCISRELVIKVLPERLCDREALLKLMEGLPLVSCDTVKYECYPHEILRGFLLKQLARADARLRREACGRAGDYCRGAGRTKEAVGFFFRAEDYEGILACELTGLALERFDEAAYADIAEAVLDKCPEQVQARYPVSVLRLCCALFAAADFRGFERHMERVRLMLEAGGDRQLLGEWQLAAALLDFPDLDRMGERYRRAAELMTGDSQVFTYREPFMFGSTSMWYLFYRQPGEMMATAKKLAEVMEIYNGLTNGHGAGAAELYLGEALSVQARFEESEIQAYQAAFLSERGRNASVTYGAALLLGINAVYQDDMPALKRAIEYLESRSHAYPFLQGTAINTCMAETVRGYLLGLMMEPGRSALWTQSEADSLGDLTFTNFMVKTCRITDMVLKKDYRRAIASVETSLGMDKRLISLSTENFMNVGLALCYLAIGRVGKAAEHLDRALSLSEQDENFSFIASFRKYFALLFLLPSIAERHSKAIREIRALKIRYTRAEESRVFAMLEEGPECTETLTDREREIAGLVASGLRNSEIAGLLHVSENTVKTHLKAIFKKLNIDRRSRLVELLE